MRNISRPAPFVLVSSNHGTMIVNRNDFHKTDEGTYGVGAQILNRSSFDQQEVDFALALLTARRVLVGPGVVALDCGANIGVHTIEWARVMHEWGHVHAFEAQEKLFYALAGNVVINNCLNVTAHHVAVGAECGELIVPQPDYLAPGSYGSLELKAGPANEFIGQKIDYAKGGRAVRLVSIDSLHLSRLDFIKIDVEGMEMDVLAGASDAIGKHKPIAMVEVIKSDRNGINAFFTERGYTIHPMDINILAVHRDDPVARRIKFGNNQLWIE
jgi:FkbM family methyltransferase